MAEYAIRKQAGAQLAFDVRIIALEDQPSLLGREGQTYLKEGKVAVWKNDDLQSFTPLRFLPPQLMDYEGRAVVIDPDVFAVSDISPLFSRDMQGRAICARRILAKPPQRPAYWASSVMLLDCAKLSHWHWQKNLDELFSNARDYREWMSLGLEDQSIIGELEEIWNHFDTLTPQTKFLHNTGRITQPWKTGLPIDFVPKASQNQPTMKWKVIPRSWIGKTKAALYGGTYHRPGYYRPHPDKNQERFFFSLLSEAIEKGYVRRDQVEEAISKQYVRRDALNVLARVKKGDAHAVRL